MESILLLYIMTMISTFICLGIEVFNQSIKEMPEDYATIIEIYDSSFYLE